MRKARKIALTSFTMAVTVGTITSFGFLNLLTWETRTVFDKNPWLFSIDNYIRCLESVLGLAVYLLIDFSRCVEGFFDDHFHMFEYPVYITFFCAAICADLCAVLTVVYIVIICKDNSLIARKKWQWCEFIIASNLLMIPIGMPLYLLKSHFKNAFSRHRQTQIDTAPQSTTIEE